MGVQEFFVVQPYEKGRGGKLYACQPIPAKDAVQAIRLAQSLNTAGAIAYSRTVDQELGEYENAVILLVAGEVPDEAREAA